MYCVVLRNILDPSCHIMKFVAVTSYRDVCKHRRPNCPVPADWITSRVPPDKHWSSRHNQASKGSNYILRTQAPPDSKVHGANMGSICGRQDPGGPHVGPMNFVIWAITLGPCQKEHSYSFFLDLFWSIFQCSQDRNLYLIETINSLPMLLSNDVNVA